MLNERKPRIVIRNITAFYFWGIAIFKLNHGKKPTSHCQLPPKSQLMYGKLKLDSTREPDCPMLCIVDTSCFCNPILHRYNLKSC